MATVEFAKLGVVFRREYLERVRSRWFLIGTVLGPVFFAAIMVLPAYLTLRQKPTTDLANVIVLDASGTGLGAGVASALAREYPASPAPRVNTVTPPHLPAAQDAAALAVARREAKGVLVIDSSTVASRSVYYAGRNASSLNDVQAIVAVVRQQVLAQRLAREGLDPARTAALTAQKLEPRTARIGDRGLERGSGIGNLVFGYIVAFLLYMMILIYGQNVMRGVLEEKTTRVAEVVVSSVTPDTLLAGKVTGAGLVAITQVVAWVALSGVLLVYGAPLVFRGAGVPGTRAAVGTGAAGLQALPQDVIAGALPSPGAAVVMLGFFVLGFVFYASLFAAIGAMVSSQEDVQQASMPVMLLVIASIVFMQPILVNPESTLARTMSLLPFSAPILMPLRMSLVAVPWWELSAALGGVVVACVAAIWISARIYRVGLLMYGKRPSFGELARWIRYAG